MTLHISSVFTYDEDAGNYIQAVEAADGQALEGATRQAINNFVLGCKADGIWDAIKASCILAGARTLNGALVPLAGAAPTPYAFLPSDYNRKTGLTGDGSTKYLDSGYVFSQNNNHIGLYPTSLFSGQTSRLASAADSTGATAIFISQGVSPDRLRSRNGTTIDNYFYTGTTPGFTGISRASSASYLERADGSTFTNSVLSTSIGNVSAVIFAENRAGSIAGISNPTLAFFSLGEALDLALLDARVTDLINAFGVAIP